jgi:hypothetical protein
MLQLLGKAGCGAPEWQVGCDCLLLLLQLLLLALNAFPTSRSLAYLLCKNTQLVLKQGLVFDEVQHAWTL